MSNIIYRLKEQSFSLIHRVYSRPRSIRLPSVIDGSGRLIPIYESIFFFDFFTVCCLCMFLWNRIYSIIFQLNDSIDQCFSWYCWELLEQCIGCFSWIYTDLLDFYDIPLIHTFAHFHNSYACFCVTMEQTRLYRWCSSIMRKDWSVDIYTQFLGHLEQIHRQYFTICYNYKIITFICSYMIQEIYISPDLFGLIYGNVMLHGVFLCGTGSEQLIPSKWFIRISDNKRNFKTTIIYEIRENNRCQEWSSEKSNTNHT